ncbi:MAG: ABC transporter substrate-binding protein [Brevinema sp.]
MKHIVLYIGVIAFFASCGANNSQQTSSGKEIIHAMGSSIVPNNPKRIIVLTGESTEALLALGVKPIAAVSSYTPDLSWYPHISNQMSGVEIIGDERQVNLEKIARLQPDLIIGIKARQENIYPTLSKIAPTVFVEKFFGEWKENFFLVAQSIGQEEKATTVMADWEAKKAILNEKLAQKGVLDKTTALYRFTTKGARYYGNPGFSASIVKELGFKRPPSHDQDVFNFEVSKELIPNMEAEQAFYFVFSEENPRAAYDNATNFITNVIFKSLSHKGTAIYEVNNDTWNKSYGMLAAYEILDEISNIFLRD